MLSDDVIEQLQQLRGQQRLGGHAVGQHECQGLLEGRLGHDGGVEEATEKRLLGSILGGFFPAGGAQLDMTMTS